MAAVDPQNLKIKHNEGFPHIAFCATRVPETERLIFGSSDAKLYEVDLSAEKLEPQPFEAEGHASYVTGITAAGGAIVSGSYDGRLIWWDAETREQIRSVEAHEKWIRNVVASPDGKTVASVADDMLCKLWDAESGELLHTLSDHEPLTPHNYPSMLYAVKFSPDGKYFATADKIGHVAIWDAREAKKVGEVEAPGMYTWDSRQRLHSIGGIRSLAFSPDSKLLAAGGIGKIGNIDHLDAPARIEVFDWNDGEQIHEIESTKFKGLVEQMVFHPEGQWFAATGGDHGGFISFYETETAKELHEEKAPMHVHDFAFSDTFETIYTVGHGRITTWELKPEETEPEPETNEEPAD